MNLRRMRLPLAVLLVLSPLVAAPAAHGAAYGAQPYAPIALPADPADQPPFDGGRTYQLAVPPPGDQAPAGFRLNTEAVTAIASEAVAATLDSHAYRVRVRTRLASDGERQWQVDFFETSGS